MPEQDALAAIGLVSESLLAKLSMNNDLCSSVMALVGYLAIEMKGCRATAVKISDVDMVGRQMRARVTFEFLGGASTSQDLPGSDRLAHHLGQEGKVFYDFIRKHPDMIKWLRQIVEKMETYAISKGMKFVDVGFGDHGAFVDPGRIIVLEICA